MPTKSFDGAYLTAVETPVKEESVDKNGNLIDKNGKLILDKNGKPIKGAGNAADDNKAADDNNGPAKKNDTVPKAPPASPTPTGPAGKKAN